MAVFIKFAWLNCFVQQYSVTCFPSQMLGLSHTVLSETWRYTQRGTYHQSWLNMCSHCLPQGLPAILHVAPGEIQHLLERVPIQDAANAGLKPLIGARITRKLRHTYSRRGHHRMSTQLILANALRQKSKGPKSGPPSQACQRRFHVLWVTISLRKNRKSNAI